VAYFCNNLQTNTISVIAEKYAIKKNSHHVGARY
jgi:hypothetical protein